MTSKMLAAVLQWNADILSAADQQDAGAPLARSSSGSEVT